ncbi:MAG: ABC transporter ATP-binding protein/permease [Ruminococcus sp.]|nr:ABC transporter ATP-binding protein/permease [Ruminococcus sp.]
MFKVFKNLKARDVIFILICAGLVVVQVWLDLTMPDYTQKLAESVSAGSIDMEKVLANGGMMLLCAVGSMLSAMFCGFFAAQIAANFAKTLREKLFGNILRFSNSEINKFSTPSLITRTTNDVVQLQMFMAMGLQMLIKAPVTAIWAIAKISNSSIEWTRAVLVCVIVIVVTILTLVLTAYPKFKSIQKLTDNLNDVTRENISGVRVVRAFNAEKYQEKKFDNVNDAITKNHLFTSRIMGLMMPVMMMAMNGVTLAIYWIGAYLVNDAEIAGRAEVVGNMSAFTQYAMQVIGAFMMLVMIFIIMPRTLVSAKRINEVLETEPTIDYKSEEIKSTTRGKIEFKNVSFAYGDSGKPCIKNVSFEINSGETFAIIGATGTGKSTLVNLIPRYYDVTGGEILIDGVNIKEYPEEQLERIVSVAPQKATLFSGDIKSNITYGCKEEVKDTDERIKRSLEISKSDFVNNLSDGIHAKVAQGGTNYSGGQKQRLSIARAVFKNSEIMIFDDTFSALDYKTDMLVRKAIREELSDTTVIIVAQRIGTIRNADKILVLHDGEIAGIGKHEDLMKNCDIYKEIALSQLSAEELSGKESA